MANQHDSFIDEVTEDLRRDRLFGAMRRYGWVVLLLILAIVAGAAWREYSRTRAETRAQAFGDALLAAESASDPAAALSAVNAQGGAGREALARMLAADAQLKAGERSAAAATLNEIGGNASLPAVIRDLARLKGLMLQDGVTDAAQRDATLSELSAPGAPYRLLALELKAVALIEAGRDDDAATLIRKIQQEQGLSENLRRRLAEMLITLGVEADPAPAPVSSSALDPAAPGAASDPAGHPPSVPAGEGATGQAIPATPAQQAPVQDVSPATPAITPPPAAEAPAASAPTPAAPAPTN